MRSRLIEVEGQSHFITQRFDREGDRKLHMQTLAALYPDADSYEKLLMVCRKMRLPESAQEEIFRRMIFNILANNTDDHNKNFSFLMDEAGHWQLSPAYDMTYIFNTGGFLPEKMHCLMLRGKLQGHTLEDVMAFAKENGIRRAEAIIEEVSSAIKGFREFAEESGVAKRWISSVESSLNAHLAAWGLAEHTPKEVTFEVNGVSFRNVRVEQVYKGNFHLLCEVEGRERKYVIARGKDEYTAIEQTGPENLSEEQLRSLVERYLIK